MMDYSKIILNENPVNGALQCAVHCSVRHAVVH